MSSQEKLFQLFEDGTLSGKTATDICKTLGIPYREKSRLIGLLDTLVEAGKLFVSDGDKYGTIEQLGLIKGTLSGNERGFAFLIPDDKELYPNDFFIPHKALRGALHGDRVLMERVYNQSDDEGQVIKILSRGYTKVVGTFRRDRRAGASPPRRRQ